MQIVMTIDTKAVRQFPYRQMLVAERFYEMRDDVMVDVLHDRCHAEAHCLGTPDNHECYELEVNGRKQVRKTIYVQFSDDRAYFGMSVKPWGS